MDTRPHPTPRTTPRTLAGHQTRTANLLAATTLSAGYLLLVPFWVITGLAVARDNLVPGSAALFTGGILLVAVNAWLQGPVAVAKWRTRRVAGGWLQALALAGRVVIQAGIALQSIAAGHSEPLPMIVLFAAFGACRTIPVLVQWRRYRSAPTIALAITEGTNLASIGLLGVAWVLAAW